VTLEFTKNGIAEIAKVSADVNSRVENIGARRLHTVMERLLDDISFSATDRDGESVKIDKAYVTKHVGELATDTDLSKFIL
jgi:ATP-dependent HslUV protease ATP-binding subunit HslU